MTTSSFAQAARVSAKVICFVLATSCIFVFGAQPRARAQAGPAGQAGPDADFDGDGLSNVDEALLQTDPRNPDTDRDGFSDGWEVHGVERYGLFEPLHHLDAHPLLQDVFVEIDWMERADGDPWRNANIAYQAAVDIARAFDASGTGIRVHFDLGSDIESFVEPLRDEGFIPDFSDFGRGPASERIIPYRDSFPVRPACANADPIGSLYDLYHNESFFRPSRRNLFYYLVIAEKHGDPDFDRRPGFTDSFADEAARRDGLKPTGVHVGVIYRQALDDKTDSDAMRRYKFSVSLLHELGHCMGLGHGGGTPFGRWDNRNFKPNYPSVMNHLYQFRGVDSADGLPVLDFSHGRFHDLQETRLVEVNGVGPTLPNQHLLDIWKVAHLEFEHAPYNLDWNGNGSVDFDFLQQDLNLDGKLDDKPFTDHDDWGKFQRDGFTGIGRNSHAGCGLSCQKSFEVIRLPGDFNGDGLPDMTLFSGDSISIALGNQDHQMRVPRGRVFRNTIQDWKLTYDDQIITARLGPTEGDKLFLHRGSQAALFDFNLQGAEILWMDERIGDERRSWEFSSGDRFLAIRLPTGQDAILVSNRDSAAVIVWADDGLRVWWHSASEAAEGLKSLAQGQAIWFEKGRSDSVAGRAWLRSEKHLFELSIDGVDIGLRQHDASAGEEIASGVLPSMNEGGASWLLSRADCFTSFDFEGDGTCGAIVRNRNDLAILDEDTSGNLRVLWSSRSADRPWGEDSIDRLFAGSFRSSVGENAIEQIVLISHPNASSNHSTWRALDWNSETAELQLIAESRDMLAEGSPAEWQLKPSQRVEAGQFLAGHADLLISQDRYAIAVIGLIEDAFEVRAVSRGRIREWTLSSRDNMLISRAKEFDLPLLKRDNHVAALVINDGNIASAISRIDPNSLMLRPAESFLRGDSNFDGSVDLSDALTLLVFLFQGGQPIVCEDAADADDTGELDISDAVRLLNRLFIGGSPIPLPGIKLPGIDPTPDELGCDTSL